MKSVRRTTFLSACDASSTVSFHRKAPASVSSTHPATLHRQLIFVQIDSAADILTDSLAYKTLVGSDDSWRQLGPEILLRFPWAKRSQTRGERA